MNVDPLLPPKPVKEWLLLLAPTLALLWLVIDTYYNVAVVRLWSQEEYAYAPLLAVVALALFLYRIPRLFAALGEGTPLLGGGLLSAGLVLYIVGRSQRIELVELFATIPMFAGFIATIGGRRALKAIRFPLLFLLFTIPYPSWILYILTSPLKTAISAWTECVLHFCGYPVARSGVVLMVGSYRMLVADACSGMHSLIFLVALGLLYLHLTGPRHFWHRSLLVAGLVPIAVVANFIRVLVLVLTTYHFGEAAGQSYYHTVAGLLLFVCGFFCLFTLDEILTRLYWRFFSQRQRRETHLPHGDVAPPASGRITPATSFVLTLALLCTGIGSGLLQPQHYLADSREKFVLEELLPSQIGIWRQDTGTDDLVILQTDTANAYSQNNQALNRTYVNDRGYRIMLSISYGSNQLGTEFQAHRPESCYRAQGFVLLDSATAGLVMDGQMLEVRQLVAQQNRRIEPISYWMTIGDTATLPGVPRKIEQLRYSVRGVIPDGMLIRVSSIDGDLDRAFDEHYRFISDLQRAVPSGFGFVVR